MKNSNQRGPPRKSGSVGNDNRAAPKNPGGNGTPIAPDHGPVIAAPAKVQPAPVPSTGKTGKPGESKAL